MSDPPPLSVVVLDDDPDVAAAAALALRGPARRVDTLLDPAALPDRLAAGDSDVLVLDLNYRRGRSDGQEGLALIERVRGGDPAIGLIVITAYAGVATAVEAMKRGADDFVAKPWSNARFSAAVDAIGALARRRRRSGPLTLPEVGERRSDMPFVAASHALRDLLATARRLAPTELTVLIRGETGVGKNRLAEALHAASPRRNRPLQLFSPGLVSQELAGGAVFVEELADLSAAAQAELVGLLDRRDALAFRAIAATNRTPAELAGAVRADLRSRLSGMELVVPPLRERPADVEALLEQAVRRFEAAQGAPRRTLPAAVVAAAVAAPWPGNARQVLQAAERAVALCEIDAYRLEDFGLAPAAAAGASRPIALIEPASSALADLEREAVRKALHEAGFNVAQAAKLLGVSRAALYRRMEKHGL